VNSNVSPALKELALEINGKIKADGELYYGPANNEIYISGGEDGTFFLASQHPLYTLKRGRPRRVSPGTKGEDTGWYYAKVPREDIRKALSLALGAEEQAVDPSEFGYETLLRDHCARNLSEIEKGLSLYKNGVEFEAGGRFIDILATDAKGGFVVFEFKLSRGADRTLGQLLYYMNWIRQNIAKTRAVRGVIIARQIGSDLRLAASSLSDVKLIEYKLSIVPKPV
jgi:hypothetical protein